MAEVVVDCCCALVIGGVTEVFLAPDPIPSA